MVSLKYSAQSKANSNVKPTTVKTPETNQTRKKLEQALHRLEINLLTQIHVFLDWRQTGLRINPVNLTYLVKDPEVLPTGCRPRGLLLEADSAEASAIKGGCFYFVTYGLEVGFCGLKTSSLISFCAPSLWFICYTTVMRYLLKNEGHSQS